MTELNDTNAASLSAPPYISFRTLLNLIERMATEGAPRRIDRSFLSGLSGGYQTQVMAALRWLGLIGDGGAVQDRLTDLVDRPEERSALIATILRERYPEVVALGEENATQGQLEEEFKKYGISGATLRKAVAFYLHAANFAGISLSPFFKTPTTSDNRTTTRRRRTRTTVTKTPPEPDGTTSTSGRSASKTEELRTRYIEMLMKRVDEQEEIDDRLLDRIEALLGYGAAAQPESGESEN